MKFEDYHAIEKLINLYPYYLDAGDFAKMGQLFAHATIKINGETIIDSDPTAVAETWASYVQIYDNGTPMTHHIATNVMIDMLDDDHARAHSYILVVQDPSGTGLAPITAGDYLDEFEKVDGVWRFRLRSVGNDLFGDMSHHLKMPMPTAGLLRPQRWGA
jgi:hypothetical protein